MAETVIIDRPSTEPASLPAIVEARATAIARAEAAAGHVKVKTEMLQLRLMEKRKELVRRADVDALIDGKPVSP